MYIYLTANIITHCDKKSLEKIKIVLEVCVERKNWWSWTRLCASDVAFGNRRKQQPSVSRDVLLVWWTTKRDRAMLCRIGHDDAPRMDIVLELLKSAQVGGVTHLRDQSALFAEAFGEMREYTPEKKSMYAQWSAVTLAMRTISRWAQRWTVELKNSQLRTHFI